MPDDTSEHGHHRAFISITQPHEIRHWTRKLGVSEDELKRAVLAVGNDAEAVEQHLRRRSGRDRNRS